MKNSISLIVFILSTFITFAYEFKGIVLNEQGSPVVGATVYIPEFRISVLTDKEGKFVFQNLPTQRFNIVVKAVGFKSYTELVELEETTFERMFRLSGKEFEFNEVIVTADLNTNRLSSGYNFEKINEEEIFRFKSQNLLEPLQRIPGVSVISQSPGIVKPVIRGFGMNNVTVLYNGARHESYQFSDHHPIGLDPFSIDGVEIIKGPASVLYGTDAIGGVLNVIQEKNAPESNVQVDISSQFHTVTNGIMNSIGFKGTKDKNSFGLRLYQKGHRDFIQGEGEIARNTRFDGFGINGFGRVNFGKFYSNFTILFSRENLALPEEEAFDYYEKSNVINPNSYTPKVFYLKNSNFFAQLENKFFISNQPIILNLSYQRFGFSHIEGLDSDGNTIIGSDMLSHNIFLDAKTVFSVSPKVSITTGLQEQLHLNRNTGEGEHAFLPDANVNNLGAFALVDYSPSKKLNIGLGLRGDFNVIGTHHTDNNHNSDNHHNETEPFEVDKNFLNLNASVSLLYKLSNQLSIKGNFATAYRNPNLTELTSNGKHELRFEKGDPDLRAQKVFGSELSLNYLQDEILLEITGFLNFVQDYIALEPTNDFFEEGVRIYQFRQFDANLNGVEARLHYNPSFFKNFHLDINYQKLIGEKKDGTKLPFIPADNIYSNIALKFEKLAFFTFPEISINPVFVFETEDFRDGETIPSYFLLNLSADAYLQLFGQNFQLGLSVHNLFDKKYVDVLSNLREVGYFFPGRNIVFSIRIPLIFNI